MKKLILAVLVGCCSLSALASEQKRNYRDNTIKGTWALSVRGETSTDTLAPVGTALVAVATITFDGHGGCSSIDQIILGGVFIPDRNSFRSTDDCTYSVNSDGTGSFDVIFPGAGPTEVTFVIENRKSIHFIANNESLGIFGGGVLKKQ